MGNNMQSEQQPSYAEQMKGKTGYRRIRNALSYSLSGWKQARSEEGFRQLIWINGSLIAISFLMNFSTPVHMILIFASFFSLIVELFNTGVEAAVDHTSLAEHPLAKRAKDVCSTAQYLSLILLAILWVMALFF